MELEPSLASELHTGHRRRLLERYIAAGMEAFSDVEVLEFLLSYAISRRDVSPLAHSLLREFGSLYQVFAATPDQLTRVPGVGLRTAALLRFCFDTWGRCENSRHGAAVVFRNMGEIGQFLINKAMGRREETAWLLSMDGKSRLLDCRVLCTGAVNSVNLPFRKLVEAAIMTNATSVVLAHNHFTGSIIPSPEDIRYTRDAADALKMMDVILLDHLIIAGRDYLSMRLSKLL